MENINIKDFVKHIDNVYNLYGYRFHNKNNNFKVGNQEITFSLTIDDVINFTDGNNNSKFEEKYKKLDNFIKLNNLFDNDKNNIGVFVYDNSKYLGVISPNGKDDPDLFLFFIEKYNSAILVDINCSNPIYKELYYYIFLSIRGALPFTYNEELKKQMK